MLAGVLCAAVVASTPNGAVADDGSTWSLKVPTSLTVEQMPTSIAALGDSITRGFNACGFYADCTSRSWSTGTDDAVNSHRDRLEAAGADITAVHNFARSGARIGELADQMRSAADSGAEYLTVEIGANDACRRDVGQMTSVAEFRSGVRAAFDALRTRDSQALVFVASIPDLTRLWEVGKGSRFARMAWDKLDICQALLARPMSKKDADVTRRAAVRDRVQAFNAELAAACADYGSTCRWDNGTVFNYRFTLKQLTRWDFFHPDKGGQRALSAATWRASFFAS